MVLPHLDLAYLLLRSYELGDSVDRASVVLFFNDWPEISAHDEERAISTQIACKPVIGLNLDNLRVEQRHNNAWVFHDFLPLILAFLQLFKSLEFEIDRPCRIKLILPSLQQSLKHQDLVTACICLGVNLS